MRITKGISATRFLPLLVMAVSALQPPASARAEDAAGEWKPNGESEGIRLFVREIEGTPLVAVRGEAEIDAPPGRIAHVILDCSRTHEWVDNLEECRWLRKVSETEYVTYNHFGTPFVMKDRDFVTRILIDVDAAKKTLALNFKAVEDPAMPETRYVRGEVVFSRYVLTALGDGSRTRLTGEVLADPKGTVPKWIVNIFQRKWPLKTLKSLRRQVAKKDIVTPAFFLDPFAKGKSP